MKIIIKFLFLCLCTHSFAQQGWQLLPEFSLGQPMGAFSEGSFATNPNKLGTGGGIHLDKLQVYKNFGLGVYFGYHNQPAGTIGNLPIQLNTSNVQGILFSDVSKFNWQQFQVAIGPTYNLPLGRKFSLQAFSKAGISYVQYPEYRNYYSFIQPIQEEITIFESNTPKEYQQNINFMWQNGVRLQYRFTANFGLQIGMHHTFVNQVQHVFTERAVNYDVSQDPELFYEQLKQRETKTYLAKCNINQLSYNFGIVIGIGNKREDKVIKEKPKTYTLTERYDCQGISYQAPDYGKEIILTEQSSETFRVHQRNAKSLQKQYQQELVFYKRDEKGAFIEIKRQTMDKESMKVSLKEYGNLPNYDLYWEISTKDITTGESTCPGNNTMMMMRIFPNSQVAQTESRCLQRIDDRQIIIQE